MLLAVDIGNTNIVFGVHDGLSWVNHWRVYSDSNKMPDEYGVLVRDLLREEGISRESITEAVISSVVPILAGRIQDMIEKMTGFTPLIVGPGVKTGLNIMIENPAELGTDILCNCVAAYEKVKQNCIVVDFGTALTFTAIKEPGQILGVSIAPGLQAAAEALSEHTAQLPHVWLEPPSKAIGKNSIKSIQSGVIFGYTGLVESLIDRMKKELGGDVVVLGTGGRSGVIAPLTDRFSYIEPWLILDGLRIIAQKNKHYFKKK